MALRGVLRLGEVCIRVLDMAATDRIRVSGYHFPFPATGHLARDGQGYRFHRSDWA